MSRDSTNSAMKCPKCGKYSLKRGGDRVLCRFCGHVLSPGEETRFRLYEMLREPGS